MKEATACVWLETNDYQSGASWWSYGLLNESNAYTFSLINETKAVELIMGNKQESDLPTKLPAYDRVSNEKNWILFSG